MSGVDQNKRYFGCNMLLVMLYFEEEKKLIQWRISAIFAK